MLELAQRPGVRRVLCATLLVGSSIWHVIPVYAQAEFLPATVRACRSETDSVRRLACFDRETARFDDPVTPAEPRTPAAETSKRPERPAPKESAVVQARVVSVRVDHWPDGLVVHLDNGQTWEQVQAAVLQPNLRVGGTVTIEKRVLGTYWLTTASGETMKVRLRKK